MSSPTRLDVEAVRKDFREIFSDCSTSISTDWIPLVLMSHKKVQNENNEGKFSSTKTEKSQYVGKVFMHTVTRGTEHCTVIVVIRAHRFHSFRAVLFWKHVHIGLVCEFIVVCCSVCVCAQRFVFIIYKNRCFFFFKLMLYRFEDLLPTAFVVRELFYCW